MGLQLRVIDGIRKRVVQVEERDARHPVRVGSGADCDVRVSVGAALQCELFVHEGRWVMRPVTGNAAVRVAGKVVTSASYLYPNDRITLGDTDATAVIEVGPMAVAAGGMARPTAPDQIPELMTPAEGDETWFQEDPDEIVPMEAIGRPMVRRPVRRKSGGGMGWTILFVLLIVGGGAGAWWRWRPREEPAGPALVATRDAAATRTTMPATGPTRSQKNIFDAGWQAGTTGTAPARQAAATIDPRKREEDWVALEKAVNGSSAARAVYAVQEYREKHPGQFEAELTAFQDDALDRIWWQRVTELCDRRDELNAEIRQISHDITEETDEEHRKKLEEDRTAKEALLRWESEALTKQMGYEGNEAPNVADEEMIARLRQERDAALYEAWKARVVKSVMATRGYLPWERAR